MNLNDDIKFVQGVLPDHYSVTDGTGYVALDWSTINCVSSIGIRQKIDAEDDEHWGYVMNAFRQHFGKRFIEVNHSTCFCHTNFTIYLKN